MHERRKYLARDANGRMVVLRFVGLGRRGEALRARAERLARSPSGVAPGQLRDGFLALEHVGGRPFAPGAADRDLVAAAAAHVAWLHEHESVGETPDVDRLIAMVKVNAGEALGPGAAAAVVRRLERERARVASGPVIAGDGRMLPHEWIQGATRLVKTDALDHHDDHFFPGAQDPAFDLAGAIAEMNLDRGGADELVARYAALATDPDVRERLPFYEAVYAAWRARLLHSRRAAPRRRPRRPQFAREAHRFGDRLQATARA